MDLHQRLKKKKKRKSKMDREAMLVPDEKAWANIKSLSKEIFLRKVTTETLRMVNLTSITK